MATIPTPGSELRHVRKTITFTGGAGAGAVGTVTVFTVTGRVQVRDLTAFATTALSGAGTPTVSIGSANRTAAVISAATPPGTNKWLDDTASGGHAELGFGLLTAFTSLVISLSDSLIITVGTNAITSGVLVVDAWYTPITDDGALAGDDIDEPMRDHFWAKALSDIASVPAMTASALSGLNWLFALARNKRTQTATTETVYKDDGSTSLATSTKSDDGTTYTRGEYS